MSVINSIYEKMNQRQPSSALPTKDLASIVIWLLAGLMALFFILPLIGLVWRAVSIPPSESIGASPVRQALSISLSTTSTSMLITLLLGTPTALLLARYRFPFKGLLSTFIDLPIVMPPVVAGMALLSAFGRRGLLGSTLELFGLSVPFTQAAVVMAQVFVAAPFYIRAAQSRFSTVPMELEEAACIDGANRWLIFSHITLPLSLDAMLTGLALSWARALGEFGATILFAGNLQGSTQTMPLMVYSAMERDLGSTFTTALILLALAAMLLGVMRWFAGQDKGGE